MLYLVKLFYEQQETCSRADQYRSLPQVTYIPFKLDGCGDALLSWRLKVRRATKENEFKPLSYQKL